MTKLWGRCSWESAGKPQQQIASTTFLQSNLSPAHPFNFSYPKSSFVWWGSIMWQLKPPFWPEPNSQKVIHSNFDKWDSPKQEKAYQREVFWAFWLVWQAEKCGIFSATILQAGAVRVLFPSRLLKFDIGLSFVSGVASCGASEIAFTRPAQERGGHVRGSRRIQVWTWLTEVSSPPKT
jgi:hypothetical protein